MSYLTLSWLDRGTMPRALSALALRAIVLCTISTTTTGSRVVLVDGFLTGKLASRSPDCAPRRQFRLDEFCPLRAPAQIRGGKSSPQIDAGPVAALQACCLESPATLHHLYVDSFDASLSHPMHFCSKIPHVQATSAQHAEQNLDTFLASMHSPTWGCSYARLREISPRFQSPDIT